MTALAWIASIVANEVGYKEALPKACTCSNASYGSTLFRWYVVQVDHLVICEGKHAIALCYEIVDHLHPWNAELARKGETIDDPIKVCESTCVVCDDARHRQDCDYRLWVAAGAILPQKGRDDILERLVEHVWELFLANQSTRRPLAFLNLGTTLHAVQLDPRRCPTAICCQHKVVAEPAGRYTFASDNILAAQGLVTLLGGPSEECCSRACSNCRCCGKLAMCTPTHGCARVRRAPRQICGGGSSKGVCRCRGSHWVAWCCNGP
mmetsp:Transcript_101703/g.286743  ORF Transcript_101703/g.286743 Transcript_101703/m.286743 type:complete len:265 (-) Transcript_101703:114-908(-)